MAPKKSTEQSDTFDPELAEILAQEQAQAQTETGPQQVPQASGMVTQDQFAATIQALVSGLANLQLKPEVLKEILVETGKTNAEIAKKLQWPENPDHPHISAYSYPEGDIAHPKEKLVRDTFFCGVREEEERLTPGEIVAYNAITGPREARGGAWRAEIIKPKAVGGKEALFVWVPKETVDQRMTLPSLPLILHELNGGGSTEDVMGLLMQIEKLKAALQSKGMSAEELEAALLS